MQIRKRGTALFWTAAIGAIVLALTVGFFVRGGTHGLYMDDYAIKASAFDFATMKWKPSLVAHPPQEQVYFRPFVYLVTPNVANALPKHEFPVRLGLVLIHLFNVLLLAKLAQRLTASLLAAVIAGSCFLLPVIANEGLLFFTAAIADTISLFLSLVGLHLLLSSRSLLRDWRLLTSGITACILANLYYEPGIFIYILLPFIFAIAYRDHAQSYGRVWLTALAGIYIPLGFYLMFVVRSSTRFVGGGGLTPDLHFLFIHRIPDIAATLYWMSITQGLKGYFREAVILGWHEWRGNFVGSMVLFGLIGSLCLAGLAFPDRNEIRGSKNRFNGVKLAVLGLAWAGLGVMPILLSRTQGIEFRILYIPWAGLAFCAGGLSLFLADALGPWRRAGVHVVLLAAGVFILFSSLVMAGLVRTYQLRGYLDQEQLMAVCPLLSKVGKTDPTWFLPVGMDERTVSAYWGRDARLDLYLAGVFETPWSAASAIALQTGQSNLHPVVSNRWGGLHVTALGRSENGRIDTITVQDQHVPVENLVAFTFKGGRAALLNPLEIRSRAGSPLVIDLPRAAQIAIALPGVAIQPGYLDLDDKAN